MALTRREGKDDVAGTPRWVFKKLSEKLSAERERLEMLHRYFVNDPPTYDRLSWMKAGNPQTQQSMKDFFARSRSNFAELIVEAVREKSILRGFRTSKDNDSTGDEDAWAMWRRANMGLVSADTHQDMFSMSRGLVIVGEVNKRTQAPLVTSEDPRQCITWSDPADPFSVRAALKMYKDAWTEKDFAFLWLEDTNADGSRKPGSCVRWVWERGGITSASEGAFEIKYGGDWTLVKEMCAELPYEVPVTQFNNKNCMGEFESVTTILDRINFMILQRVMIAALQAFKQRAIMGADTHYPDNYPDASLRGKKIDYSEMFFSSPDALWALPLNDEGKPVEIWESAPTDLTPILSACKDDLVHLSAITRTPLHYLNPESANQSAEGASLIREGFNTRAEDRQDRTTPSWSRVAAQMFDRMGDPRGKDLSTIVPIWREVNAPSLSERASSAKQLETIMPWRSLMLDIMGYEPDKVDRMETEKAAEDLLKQAKANAQLRREETIKAEANPPAAPADNKPAPKTGNI